MLFKTIVALLGLASASEAGQPFEAIDVEKWELKPKLTVTHQCYLDIEVYKKKTGRIVFGMFGSDTPSLVHQFRHTAKGDMWTSDRSTQISFKGTSFVESQKNFAIIGGSYG